jgi:hypothetical protein
MPIRPEDLRRRGLEVAGPVREEPDVPFDDLIYLMAEGVAEAQTKLDLTTAEVLQTLAETEVDVVPRITRRIEEDGAVTTESPPPESRSLLELGFEPTRYQFSEATVEVGFDLSVTEESERETETESEYGFGLRAGTYETKEFRKFGRELESNATVTARLEPVPVPVQLSPAEETEAEESGGEE